MPVDVVVPTADGKNIIVNPIVLKCDKKIIGFAGVKKPEEAQANKDYDPVRFVLLKDNPEVPFNSSDLNAEGDRYNKLETQHVTIGLDRNKRPENVPNEIELSQGFSTPEDVVYGAMVSAPDNESFIPPDAVGSPEAYPTS